MGSQIKPKIYIMLTVNVTVLNRDKILYHTRVYNRLEVIRKD